MYSLSQIIKFSEFNRDDNSESLKYILEKSGLKLKIEEVYDLVSFFNWLSSAEIVHHEIISLTDNFHFGYSIPRISKEIDLLRIGENCHVCIEIKSEANEEKMEEQLVKDFFYLNFLKKKCYYFSYSVKDNKVVELNTDTMKVSSIDQNRVLEVLREQQSIFQSESDLNNLFSFNNYIISPFNDTDRFIKNKYFLTEQQKGLCNELRSKIYDIFLIKGEPGTGKSLLAYHLLKEFHDENINCVMIHSGQFNGGHKELRRNNFNVIEAKKVEEHLSKKTDYNYILIDEGQRIWKKQLKIISDYCKENKCKVIIFLDENQTLNYSDNAVDEIGKIKNNNTFKVEERTLKTKYRYETNIYKFISLIFTHKNSDYDSVVNSKKNISLLYFQNKTEAEEYLSSLDPKKWDIVSFTITDYDNYDKLPRNKNTSHKIIGQEFNNVVVTLNEDFNYSIQDETTGRKILITPKFNYISEKMLYQNLTRAKNELQLVIISNENLYLELLNLLSEF